MAFGPALVKQLARHWWSKLPQLLSIRPSSVGGGASANKIFLQVLVVVAPTPVTSQCAIIRQLEPLLFLHVAVDFSPAAGSPEADSFSYNIWSRVTPVSITSRGL